jgi:class 3 adenylate cyclase
LGERRIVTALAAVVALSAAQGGPVDAESRAELRAEVMHHLLPILSSEIDRHGGEVDRYRDGGLIALFGASATHEDDPERAVLAALAMQEAFQPHAAEWAAREQVAL